MAAIEEDWPTALATLRADAEIHDFDELERRDAITYRVQDGAIARMEYFSDQALGLEAVGLRG